MTWFSDLAALVVILTAVGGLIRYFYRQWKVHQLVAKLEEIFATKNQPHDNFLETKELAARLGCTDEEVDEAARRSKMIEPSSGHLADKRGYQKKVQ